MALIGWWFVVATTAVAVVVGGSGDHAGTIATAHALSTPRLPFQRHTKNGPEVGMTATGGKLPAKAGRGAVDSVPDGSDDLVVGSVVDASPQRISANASANRKHPSGITSLNSLPEVDATSSESINRSTNADGNSFVDASRRAAPSDEMATGSAQQRRRRRRTDFAYYRSIPEAGHRPRQTDWNQDAARGAMLQLERAVKLARDNCTMKAASSSSSSAVVWLDVQLPVPVLERLSSEVAAAVHAAGVLGLLMHYDDESSTPRSGTASSGTPVRDDFYSSFARALVESGSDWVHSATVVLQREGARGVIAPHVVRRSGTSSPGGPARLNVENIPESVLSSEWYSALLHRNDTLSAASGPGQSARSCSAPGGPEEVAGESRDALWTASYVRCPSTWLVAVVSPVYGCNSEGKVVIRGAVRINIDLDKLEVNQCSDASDVFAGTHRCQPTTFCLPAPRTGLKRGNYRCQCSPGYYFPVTSQSPTTQFFDGREVEAQYGLMMSGQVNKFDQLVCLPCAPGCAICDDATPCDDVIATRVILLALQIFTMIASIAMGVAIVRLRKTKVMKASFWFLLEIIIFGALLVQCTIVIEYFYPSDYQCLLVPWFREVGFIVVYGSLTLKVYRVLAEFQSRKAQRILLRDKDLLRYLLTFVIIIVGYMVTWSAVMWEHVTSEGNRHLVETRHVTGSNLTLAFCSLGWWHYVIEVGECLFLCISIYLCYCIRSAPSFYLEIRFMSFAIFNELVISAIYYIIRHCVWSFIHPTYMYLLSFLRCQLTITITLSLVVFTKVWYTHRPPSDRRRRAYSTSEPSGVESGAPGAEPLKLSADSGVDVGEINLSDMNPEDIRAELRRLYTQLQVYKTKSMRRDNPHISKRRGGRKPTHRRFSLQAFHYKHRLYQGEPHSTSDCHDLEPASRTPEESTNSADVVPTVAEEPSGCETPTLGSSTRHR